MENGRWEIDNFNNFKLEHVNQKAEKQKMEYVKKKMKYCKQEILNQIIRKFTNG